MRSFPYIPVAALALGTLGAFCGCGGAGSDEQASLPIGLKRTLEITIPDSGDAYVFSFVITSATNATVYTGTSMYPSPAEVHVVNYVPAKDTAEQIGFYWESNDIDGNTGLDALVVLYNPQNISTGTGSATCSVRDAEYPETETQQNNCSAIIHDFKTSS